MATVDDGNDDDDDDYDGDDDDDGDDGDDEDDEEDEDEDKSDEGEGGGGEGKAGREFEEGGAYSARGLLAPLLQALGRTYCCGRASIRDHVSPARLA